MTFRCKFCAQAVRKESAVFSSNTYKTHDVHDFLSSPTSSKHLAYFDAQVQMKCVCLIAGFQDEDVMLSISAYPKNLQGLFDDFEAMGFESFVPSHIPMMASNRATALLGKFLPGIAT